MGISALKIDAVLCPLIPRIGKLVCLICPALSKLVCGRDKQQVHVTDKNGSGLHQNRETKLRS